MRGAGKLEWPPRVGPSDHGCWGYSSDVERARVVTAWLVDGMARGQRAMYIAEGTSDALIGELTDLPGLDVALAGRSLVVVPAELVYDLDAPVDPEAQLARYAAVLDEALADGYLGLRAASDMTPLIVDPARRAAHARWEQVGDRYITEHPLASLCLYDTRRVRDIEPIVFAHPLQGPERAALTLYGAAPTRAVLAGELDALVADAFAELLATIPVHDDVVDIAGVSVIDGRSAQALHAELTRRRQAGQPLALVGAVPAVRRVWDACGFDPSLLA